MKNLIIGEKSYHSGPQPRSHFARRFPSLVFYPAFVANVLQSSRSAKRGIYSEEAWVRSCTKILADLERVGVRLASARPAPCMTRPPGINLKSINNEKKRSYQC